MEDAITVLKSHPALVVAIYRTFIDANPSCGWVAMLCEINRRIKPHLKDSKAGA